MLARHLLLALSRAGGRSASLGTSWRSLLTASGENAGSLQQQLLRSTGGIAALQPQSHFSSPPQPTTSCPATGGTSLPWLLPPADDGVDSAPVPEVCSPPKKRVSSSPTAAVVSPAPPPALSLVLPPPPRDCAAHHAPPWHQAHQVLEEAGTGGGAVSVSSTKGCSLPPPNAYVRQLPRVVCRPQGCTRGVCLAYCAPLLIVFARAACPSAPKSTPTLHAVPLHPPALPALPCLPAARCCLLHCQVLRRRQRARSHVQPHDGKQQLHRAVRSAAQPSVRARRVHAALLTGGVTLAALALPAVGGIELA